MLYWYRTVLSQLCVLFPWQTAGISVSEIKRSVVILHAVCSVKVLWQACHFNIYFVQTINFWCWSICVGVCVWHISVSNFQVKYMFSYPYLTHTRLCSNFTQISLWILLSTNENTGTRRRCCMRHSATRRKDANFLLFGVPEIFHCHIPYSRNMALISTHSSTEMSTRNISCWWIWLVTRAEKLTTIMCWLAWNLEAWNSCKPQGLSRDWFTF
jgi:hypothetical protein